MTPTQQIHLILRTSIEESECHRLIRLLPIIGVIVQNGDGAHVGRVEETAIVVEWKEVSGEHTIGFCAMDKTLDF